VAVARPLCDGWRREIHNLRVSVTDRGNFRCRYCMPAEGMQWLAKPELLTFEELHRLVQVMAAMGVREEGLTGGEPLVRRDLPDLVARWRAGAPACSRASNGICRRRCAKAPAMQSSRR
jgi:GTP 3',8-cyclase